MAALIGASLTSAAATQPSRPSRLSGRMRFGCPTLKPTSPARSAAIAALTCRVMNTHLSHIQVADAISPKNPTTAIATKKRSIGAIAPVTHLSFRQGFWLRLGLGLGIADGLRQHLA
jgi:hypothetical protein